MYTGKYRAHYWSVWLLVQVFPSAVLSFMFDTQEYPPSSSKITAGSSRPTFMYYMPRHSPIVPLSDHRHFPSAKSLTKPTKPLQCQEQTLLPSSITPPPILLPFDLQRTLTHMFQLLTPPYPPYPLPFNPDLLGCSKVANESPGDVRKEHEKSERLNHERYKVSGG